MRRSREKKLIRKGLNKALFIPRIFAGGLRQLRRKALAKCAGIGKKSRSEKDLKKPYLFYKLSPEGRDERVKRP